MNSSALAVLATALGRPARREVALRPAPPNLALPEETRPTAPARAPGTAPPAPAVPLVAVSPGRVSPNFAKAPAPAEVWHRAGQPAAKPRSRLDAETSASLPDDAAAVLTERRHEPTKPPPAARARTPLPQQRDPPVVATARADQRPPAKAARGPAHSRDRPEAEQRQPPDNSLVPPPRAHSQPATAETPAHSPEVKAPIPTPLAVQPEQPRAADHAQPDLVLTPLPPPPEAQPNTAPRPVPPRSVADNPTRPEIRIGTIEIHTPSQPAPIPQARAVPSRAGLAGSQVQRLSRGYGWLGRG
jgi:hypothetical protein